MQEEVFPSISRSRSTPKIHPLEDFFELRAEIENIDPQFDSYIQNSIIRYIPILDKHKRTQLEALIQQENRLKSIFTKFNMISSEEEHHFIDLPQFIINSKHSSKFYTLIISYFIFLMCIEREIPRQDSYKLFLLDVFESHTQYQRNLTSYEFYVFKKLLKGSFWQIEKEYDHVLLESFMKYITKLQSISFTIVRPLFSYFKVIQYSRHEKLNEELKLFLLHLCLRKDESVVSTDGSYIISIISNDLAELDTISIQILAHLTHCISINNIILDAFMSIPLPLFTMITRHYEFLDSQYNEPEYPNQVPPVIYNLNGFNFMEKKRSEFIDGFNNPNFNLLATKSDITSYLPKHIKDACLKIASCFQEVDSKYNVHFVKSLVKILETSKGSFFHVEMCTAFLYILLLVSSVFPSKITLRLFLDTALFNPAITVFNKNNKNDQIMTLRNTYFELLYRCVPNEVAFVLEHCKGYPLLFAEVILRIYENVEKFDILRFVKESALNNIIQTAHHLLQIYQEDVDIFEARQIIFIFMSYLIQSPQSALACFSTRCFTDGFLWFVYEEDITTTIIRLIRDGISILPFSHTLEMTVSYISLLFKSFKRYVETDNRYLILAEELATNIVYALRVNSALATLFEPNLHHFLLLIQKIKSEKIIDASFYFIDLLSHSQKNYSINITALRDFTKAIKNTYGDNPPYSVFKHLHSLLSGQYSKLDDFQFIIRENSAIPLIISCFGCSHLFPKILKEFRSLCEFSSYNKTACHNGDLDYILLKFISKRKSRAIVSYKSVDIEISIDLSLVEELIFPLLVLISSQRSNASIATLYTKLMMKDIDDTAILTCQTVSMILQNCFSKPRPYIPIGTIHPIFTVSNIPIRGIEEGFTIYFRSYVDLQSLELTKSILNLVKLVDQTDTKLTFYIEGKTINASFETNDAIANVILVPQIPNNWFDLAVSCSYIYDSEGFQSIAMVPYLNGVPDVEFDLGSQSFEGENLTIVVGGSDGGDRSLITQNLGSIGDIKIYTRSYQAYEIVNLLHAQRDKRSELFTTEMMSLDSQKYEYALPFENSPNAYIRFVSNDAMPHDFLWCAADYGIVNDLVLFFRENTKKCPENYPGFLFDIMTLIFMYSEKSQSSFNGTTDIQRFLFSNPHVLSSNTFFCTVSILKSLTIQKLIVEWLTKIVLNMWIWIQSPHEDLYRIVYFLSHFMSKQFFDIFSSISILSILCDQFYLLFCFQNEEDYLKGNSSILVPENPKADMFAHVISKMPNETLFKCREQFFGMICNLIPYKCDRFDIQTIVMHLFSAKDIYTKLFFMKFMNCIPDMILKSYNERMDTVTRLKEYLTSTNVEVVTTTIILILRLCPDFLQMLSLSIVSIVKNVPIDKLYLQLIDYIFSYPFLIQVVCLIAIRLDNNLKRKCVEVFDAFLTNSEDYSGFLSKNWFVWPLMFAFGASIDEQAVIGTLIGKILQFSNDFDADLTSILAVYNALESFSWSKIEFVGVSIIQNILSCQKFKSNIPLIADTIFMHGKTNNLNTILSEEFSRSIFHENFDFADNFDNDRYQVMIEDIKTPDSFLNFLEKDAKKLNNIFIIRTNESGKWIDKQKAMLINSYLLENNLQVHNLYIEYFLRRSMKEINCEDILKQDLFIDTMTSNYNQKYQESISQISSWLSSLLNDVTAFKEISVFGGDFALMSNTRIEIDIQEVVNFTSLPPKSETTLVKDRTSCFCLCPMKLKRKIHNPKKYFELKEEGQVLYQHSCNLIKLNSTTPYIFQLFTNEIHLISPDKEKTIRNEDIYMVLTRRFDNRETGIEIYLENGRSYLIDFVNDEHPTCINAFMQAKTPKMQILQRMVSGETFSRMHATQRWQQGFMSNFEYIVKMNILSGRSFNDPFLYPIFPSLLSDLNNLHAIQDFTNIKKWLPPLLDRTLLPRDPSKPLSSLEETLTTNKFVAPDFFYFPYVIENDNELPKWASSKFEFIYKLRKLLESDFITKMLPTWIDSIFGLRVRQIPHRQLFRVPHPYKSSILKKSSIEPTVSININNRLIRSVYTILEDISTFKFCALLDSGKLIQFNVCLEDHLVLSQPEVIGTVGDASFKIFDSYEDYFVAASPEKQTIVTVKHKNISEPMNFAFDTSLVVCSEGHVIFCPNRATLSEFSFDGDLIPSVLCRVRSNIVCCAIEPRFKLFAVALANNTVVSYDLRTKRKVNSFCVGETVLKVLITKSHGFIVVETLKDIVILSRDAEYIKRSPIPAEIIAWWKFTSPDGFDFVVFQDTENKIGYFEAFYPDTVTRFFETRSRVIWASYDFPTERFVIITHDGLIHFANIRIIQ